MHPPLALSLPTRDIARAARVLVVRSRREATGLFAGNYASAFRGCGLEFEESRPYVPGDDVRTLDWNATARNGEPYVKGFREERDQTLYFGLDVSGSMDFASGRRSKAGAAVEALALMTAAAGRAGDRSGFVAFDDRVRAEVAVARGARHGRRVIDAALAAGASCRGPTRLVAGVRALGTRARRRAVVVVISDFLDPALVDDGATGGLREALTGLARAHDLVAVVVSDPRELELPRVGPVRLADAERPGRTWVLDTRSRRARSRYREAALERRARIGRALQRCGADLLWLRADSSPLRELGRFFQERAGRRTRPAP